MDEKAAARSKRAQSQRAKSKHSTKHPHSHSQSQSQSHSKENKKNVSKQAQSSHTQEPPKPEIAEPSQTLPSNWDRYEEPVEGGDTPQQQEAVPIKSKGADYSHLISQAHELTGFDALMPENEEGINSMLYVRGCNLLSWSKDDNFIVKDDNTTAENEESFLSLDLHWLASQLGQLDRSKRLFIEEDKLPAEMKRSSDSQAEKHQLGEQQQVHSHKNELRTPSQSGKHELGEGQDQVISNENESVVSKVQSIRESYLPPVLFPDIEKSTEKADLKDYTGKNISCMEQQVTSPDILDQGTVHGSREAANLPLSTSLDSQMKVGSPLCKADSQKNVDKASGIEARKPYRSSLKIYEESNEVARHNVEAGTVRFEAVAAEAELDALLDALDKPSNVGTSEVHGTISDPVFTEKSIYKGKQPFQDQLQGPSSSSIISRNEQDTAKNTSGSKFISASVTAPKSSASLHKDAPKVVEDDFDAWLDTI